MPEGDTVWLTARRLHTVLADQVLVRAELRVPRFATADLVGRRVLEVLSRGKHLLTRIEPNLTLHTHLGMDGSYRIHRAGRWWPGTREPVRVALATARHVVVGRNLARVDLVPLEEESQLIGHLGPDLLGADWDPDEAVRRLMRDPDRSIGEALLDQSNLAGIGNLYRAELLFLRGVHPATPVRDVGDLDQLVRLAHRLLWVNREHPEQTTTGDPRRGQEHWVYRRAGQPCRRCGTTVRRAFLGPPGQERVTFWCPTCQPERPT
ncbi:DNA-formamidopyrimidine glycosylase family protein [Thermasporomyces composti]|uniref:DNA-(apurinic or apyrimidinic site) lyase n=1 Tax=Thermasporomyces composti TaxID=696763 RepID=A0A3D9V0U3_THECX|nr:DNA-formamidopyrimidine glycosylase family protein [Thermasporomyces composti]REF35099.1 endonuclease-8 [Thermasporomyces composti]